MYVDKPLIFTIYSQIPNKRPRFQASSSTEETQTDQFVSDDGFSQPQEVDDAQDIRR